MLGVGAGGPLGIVPAHAGAGRVARLSERDALIVLSAIDGLGPATLARLVERLGDAASVLGRAREPRARAALMSVGSGDLRQQRLDALVADAIVAAAAAPVAALERIRRPDVQIVTVEDDAYPGRLRAIELPPHVLHVRGSIAALAGEASVAVVGTRRPTDRGRRHAARIAAALARAGAVVVSGLALGIDGAAHEACVAEDAPTVAVLGGGLDHLYPPSHRRLGDAIVSHGGAVVSELPPALRPTTGTFPRRNRIISGLSDATVVVEAPARSGALLTASWALAQGRGLFLVPGDIDSPASAGCLAFLREVAGEARVVAGVPQLIEDLGLARLADPLRGGRPLEEHVAGVLIELPEGPRRVAAGLVAGRATADELVASTDMPIAAVLASLTILEDRGLAVGTYGRYRPAGRLASARAS